MSAHYQIFHDTHYHYDSPVSLAQQLAHLWPRPCAWQRCTDQQLQISPDPTSRRDEQDVFGNPLTRLAFERPHDELLVNASLTIEVRPRPALDFNRCPAWEDTRSALTYSSQPLSPELLDACRYRFESPYVHLKRNFVDFSASCFPQGRPLLLGVQALMEKIFSEFTFDAEATQVATPLVEVLERRRGVCQDFAHLMLACVRSRGLAARYISGYLLTQPPPGKPRTPATLEMPQRTPPRACMDAMKGEKVCTRPSTLASMTARNTPRSVGSSVNVPTLMPAAPTACRLASNSVSPPPAL